MILLQVPLVVVVGRTLIEYLELFLSEPGREIVVDEFAVATFLVAVAPVITHRVVKTKFGAGAQSAGEVRACCLSNHALTIASNLRTNSLE